MCIYIYMYIMVAKELHRTGAVWRFSSNRQKVWCNKSVFLFQMSV